MPADDIDRLPVYAKVTYKGKTYYVVAQTPDRCRLASLDGKLDFWTDKAKCELLKEYTPRKVRFGYGRTRNEYQTLGGLRRFAEEQRAAEKSGTPACGACGRRRDDLIEDLEDGMMKCRSCCDIPSE